MLAVLKQAMKELSGLLKEPDWRTLDITYELPHVKRVWRQWGDNRIYLHEIFPCESDVALWHAHPWPSAIYIAKGRYEMAVGNGAHYYLNVERTDIPAAKLILGPGTTYEMMSEDGWHYVRPLEPVMSIMVTGKPWDDPIIDPSQVRHAPQELDQHDKINIISYFTTHMNFMKIHQRL